MHERYLFGLLTLLAIAFALELRRGMPRRRLVALLAGGLLALSAVVPLAGYTQAQGATDSPTLRAVEELERGFGMADASLLVAGLASTAGPRRRCRRPSARSARSGRWSR